ncbi:MAG: DUF2341 domain-containing protein [Promethearchaeota archaeon]
MIKKADKFRTILILLCFSMLMLFPMIINNTNFNKVYMEEGNSIIHKRELVRSSATTVDFKYYKTITIDHNQVSGGSNLINFTLLISIIDSDLYLNAQPDGDDIAFFKDSIQLAHEIELFDPNYGGNQARLVAWVLLPSLSPSTDTIIYMYYGNPTMSAQENPTAVWGSNYKGVWHLNTTLLDSTANNNDGTNSVPGPDDVSAFIARGRDYLNVDHSNMGSGSSIDNIFNGGATISAWIYPEGWGGNDYGRVLDKSTTTSGTNGWVICLDGYDTVWYNQLLFYRDFSTNRGLWMSGTNTITLNQWNHIVITYDDTSVSNDPKFYINGLDESGQPGWEDDTPVGTATNDAAQSIYIGNFMGGGRGFNGVIDEVRVLSGIKSLAWVQTEYNNQYDPDSFYTVGSPIVIDNTPPDITIISPTSNSLYGSLAPSFNVEINDSSNIDTRWYRLLNGTVTTTNTTFTTNGTINQARWEELGNGTVTIQFFANDSLGNIGFSEIVVRKDNQSPMILINSPNSFDLFGTTSPTFNVEIWDINIVDTMWYTLNNGKETIFTANGTISPSIWNTCGNGTVSIKFYANDSLSNQGYSEVIVRKEVESPTIQINSPNAYDLFGNLAPTFNVEISDDNGVSFMWYTLNNGIEEYFTVNGSISQSLWSSCGNGTVSIKFYANNSLGNGGFSEVIVRKDIINPMITINSPDPSDLYGKVAPSYNVFINDPNGIESKWYTINGGITNTTFTANTGIISQTRWDEMGNGTILIRFYANDSLGNIGFSGVLVYKDIIAPTVVINTPNPYDLFGAIAPNFNIDTIDSSSISLRWYTLDDGITNITCGTTGQINQVLWNFQGNGTVSIKFYATDVLGNEGFSEVTVRKDIDPPSIIINNPTLNQSFDTTAPTFNVEILDINGIDTMWYTLDNGITNTTFTTNSSIDQILWDSFGDGIITIRFCANNSIGTTGFSEVSVMKDIEAPLIVINAPYNNTYWNHAPIINVFASDFNFDELWLSINSYDVFLTNNVNYQLDVSIWNSLPQGTFQIRLYANDSIGHLNDSVLLMLYKDTIAPDPPILNTFPQGEVNIPLIFDWEDDSDPSGISHYRLIIDTEQDPFTTPGFAFEVNITYTGIDSSYYELSEYLASGTYYFFVYQIDGAGNQGDYASDTFIIKQQVVAPPEFPWWIILLLIVPFGVTIAVISVRKSKKKVKVVVVDKQLEALREQKRQLELTAKAAMKSRNYKQAAQYYEQCRVISNQLFEEGYEEEKDKYRSYEKIENQLKKKIAAIPLAYKCINALLTSHFRERGVKYYSDPDIYPETQKAINGLILNDSKFFQERLTNAVNGPELINELKINSDMIDSINAIQFFFTNDLSEDELIKVCKAFQNPQMFLLIVGFPWPILEYDEIMSIPMDNSIQYKDNIRIINIHLLARLIGMEGQIKDALMEIIDLDFNFEELQKINTEVKIELHNTEELKQDLKQKEWFFLI